MGFRLCMVIAVGLFVGACAGQKPQTTPKVSAEDPAASSGLVTQEGRVISHLKSKAIPLEAQIRAQIDDLSARLQRLRGQHSQVHASQTGAQLGGPEEDLPLEGNADDVPNDTQTSAQALDALSAGVAAFDAQVSTLVQRVAEYCENPFSVNSAGAHIDADGSSGGSPGETGAVTLPPDLASEIPALAHQLGELKTDYANGVAAYGWSDPAIAPKLDDLGASLEALEEAPCGPHEETPSKEPAVAMDPGAGATQLPLETRPAADADDAAGAVGGVAEEAATASLPEANIGPAFQEISSGGGGVFTPDPEIQNASAAFTPSLHATGTAGGESRTDANVELESPRPKARDVQPRLDPKENILKEEIPKVKENSTTKPSKPKAPANGQGISRPDATQPPVAAKAVTSPQTSAKKKHYTLTLDTRIGGESTINIFFVGSNLEANTFQDLDLNVLIPGMTRIDQWIRSKGKAILFSSGPEPLSHAPNTYYVENFLAGSGSEDPDFQQLVNSHLKNIRITSGQLDIESSQDMIDISCIEENEFVLQRAAYWKTPKSSRHTLTVEHPWGYPLVKFGGDEFDLNPAALKEGSNQIGLNAFAMASSPRLVKLLSACQKRGGLSLTLSSESLYRFENDAAILDLRIQVTHHVKTPATCGS